MGRLVVWCAVELVLMAGIAVAQTHPPATPPPEIPAPEMGVPAPGTSTTTIRQNPPGGWQALTARLGLDKYGNPVTERGVYRAGIAGSSESHKPANDTDAGR